LHKPAPVNIINKISTYIHTHNTHTHTEAQFDGQQLHDQLHKPAPVNIINKIAKDEKILHVLHTVGFERFPGSGSTMLGEGLVILTENNVYLHHDGNMAVASVEEHL
jgi:hypothetical protein